MAAIARPAEIEVVDSRFYYDVLEKGAPEKRGVIDRVSDAWREVVESLGIDGDDIADGLTCLDKIQTMSDNKRIVLVVDRESKKVCAMASFTITPDGKSSEIFALVASPSHWPSVRQRMQKQAVDAHAPYVAGAGAALFYSICSHLQDENVERVVVMPYEHARGFYLKVGMIPTGSKEKSLQLDLRGMIYVADSV